MRLRVLALAGVGAAILVSWWLRIEQEREATVVPQIHLGQPVAAGRVILTAEALDLRQDRLILSASLENPTGSTLEAPFGLPAQPPDLLLDGKPQPAPQIILVRDDEPLQQLQPRIAERVLLIWRVPEPGKAQEVTIRFSRQIFKLQDNLYGQARWLGHQPSGELRTTPQVLP